MSHVQLQVRPRRVRCSDACEPPPFRFSAATRTHPQRTASRQVLLLPLRALAIAASLVGKLVDAAFFLVVLTVWNAMHVLVWSYAFQVGPAADCFGLPCPSWLDSKVVAACMTLAVLSYVLARAFRRLGHRATSMVLLLLVTFDVAALLLLGIGALT
jgi:hypothetical protein